MTTIDKATSLWAPVRSGERQAIQLSAGAGSVETIDGFGTIREKISRYEDTEASFSVIDIDLGPGENIPSHANLANERIAICYAGKGRVQSKGQDHVVTQGDLMFWGRGTHVSLAQEGDEPFRLSVVSLVPDAVSAATLFPVDRSGLKIAAGDLATEKSSGGFLLAQEQDGEQYWQAAPSLGFISLKFGEDLPVDYFSVSSQTLDADAFVRLHGHARSTEIVVCTRGRGLAIVGEAERDFAEGDLLILPPGVTHRFVNDSGQPWTYSGLFTPPSVESALRETGVRKMPGAERPAAIPRNLTTERLLVEKYGFIIPGLQK